MSNHDWQKRLGDGDLTRRILDRTSGRACGRAEELLGARWDGDLEAVDSELLDGHMDGCAACRELATILDWLQPMLSGLAEREPGPAFTAQVLARTSRRQPVPSRGRLERLARGLQERLRGVWRRPRIALEAAWTAAALTTLLAWTPLHTDAADRGVGEVVQAGVGAVPEMIVRIEAMADAAAVAGREVFGPWQDRLDGEIDQIETALAGWYLEVKQEGRELWQRLAGDDTQPASE